jgi:hypothetical protein
MHSSCKNRTSVVQRVAYSELAVKDRDFTITVRYLAIPYTNSKSNLFRFARTQFLLTKEIAISLRSEIHLEAPGGGAIYIQTLLL